MKKLILAIILFLNISAFAINVDSLLLKSIGGEKGLNSIHQLQSLYMEGSATMGFMKGDFKQISQIPDNLYVLISFAGFSLEQGFDGTTAWQTDMNGKRSKVTGQEEKELLKSLYLASFDYILEKSDSVDVVYQGISQFNNNDCHEIAFIFSNTDTLFTFYNLNTALREGFISRYDMMKATTIETDYRTYNNIPVAMSLVSKIEPVNFTIALSIDSISLNSEFDQSVFSFQEQSEIDYYFPEEAHTEEIEFKYVNGHIQIPVTINGKKKVWMILDSGAASNIFNTPVIDDLSLDIIGSLPAMGVAGYEQVDLLKTQSIEIGNLKLYNQVAGSMDLSQIAYASNDRESFGGILGYDFLSRFPVMIDYEKSKMIVYEPGTVFPQSHNAVEIDFDLIMQIPTVKAKINGVEGNFIIDLGNSIGLILHAHYVYSNKIDKSLTNIENNNRLVGGIGGAVGGKTAIAEIFELGTIKLDSIPVILPNTLSGITKSEQIAGNIGNPILKEFMVLFDYANSKIYLFPQAEEK